MTTPTVADLAETWTRRRWVRTDFTLAVLDRLADGVPADPDHLAAATGLEPSQVADRIEAAGAAGCEIEDGAIVGAALTLRPTRHRVRVRGNDLFAWCGFDTLFLPLLLDERFQVGSTCPSTGEAISLTVGSDGGIGDVTPPTTVVAVVGSDVTRTCDTTGPDSAVCTQMQLLSSPEAGDRWLDGRDGVAVVDLDVARRIAAGHAGRQEVEATEDSRGAGADDVTGVTPPRHVDPRSCGRQPARPCTGRCPGATPTTRGMALGAAVLVTS